MPRLTRRRVIAVLAVSAAALAFSPAAHPSAAAEPQHLKIGVTAGPHAEVMDVVKRVAARQGLDIQIIEFTDYIQPNAALDGGDLDANSFQHQPYLDGQVKDRHYQIVSIAKTLDFPMGIYSRKIKHLADVKPGARFGLPNDPTNEGRALLLLQHAGLIKLAPAVGLKAMPADVVANPKHVQFVELDAAQLPRALDDLDFAAINTNYALTAGMVPTRDSLSIESVDSPYVNVIAVRTKERNDPRFAELVKAYHSPEVKAFVLSHYKGYVIPAW
ncbi:MetQ/NlpA family ABC transporter substrate-binding protein [bacterium]|nr:MAG: MetQ/NlpA family ABC transporter substrate-binding protein [bacterium]